MQVEPIYEEVATVPADILVTRPVVETSIIVEAPIECHVAEPEIHVNVGTVNPLKKALDETCVDDCSEEFEKIGKLLDNRQALLAKVR